MQSSISLGARGHNNIVNVFVPSSVILLEPSTAFYMDPVVTYWAQNCSQTCIIQTARCTESAPALQTRSGTPSQMCPPSRPQRSVHWPGDSCTPTARTIRKSHHRTTSTKILVGGTKTPQYQQETKPITTLCTQVRQESMLSTLHIRIAWLCHLN